MARTSREDSNITGLHRESPASYSSKLHLALTAGNSEHLKEARMIMNIVIYSVPPGVSPAVALEQVHEDGGWVEGDFEPHRAEIDYDRPAGMVRDDFRRP
jgi:hypothetical protein